MVGLVRWIATTPALMNQRRVFGVALKQSRPLMTDYCVSAINEQYAV